VSWSSLIRRLRRRAGPPAADLAALLADLQEQMIILIDEIDSLRVENRRLTESMIIDPGTGLPNRAAFEADLVQLQARRQRSDDAYSVLLVDIDDFHSYNEYFGVPAGNKILATVANLVNATVRQGDRAYRYEGDQFAVLLPGASGSEAVAAAERIRIRAEGLAIKTPPEQGGVLTVTIGLVEAGFRHTNAKDVVLEATRLLEDGKEAGGNRISWPR
jgi:diguanylate cyclase (GGDEF)-like protein